MNDKTSESPVRSDDPVLLSPLNPFRNKKEIDEKVCIFAEFLGRDCSNIKRVFHSGTVDDYQVNFFIDYDFFTASDVIIDYDFFGGNSLLPQY